MQPRHAAAHIFYDIILSAALEIVKISPKLNGYDDTGADIRIVTRQ